MGRAGILEDYADVSELFGALSSPVRVAVVRLLTNGPSEGLCVHELIDSLSLPQPLVSQHLRILREANLVTGTRRGREVAYVLKDDHVAHIVADACLHTREKTKDSADSDPDHAQPG